MRRTSLLRGMAYAGALLMLATPFAAAHAADTPTYPNHLVNGDFEYPANATRHGGREADGKWTAVTPTDGTRYTGCATNTWVTIPGFNASDFGWSSTQTDGPDDCGSLQRKAGAVEIQRDVRTGNQYGESTATQADTADYQDIATTPDAIYTIRLKHASLDKDYVDRMQVLIGAPGHETPIKLTRVTGNGNGDKTGETGDVIATRVSNTDRFDHETQWETYEGRYHVPEGQTLTRFTFKCVDSRSKTLGNLIDDVEFTTAYPLAYNANGAQHGLTPRQKK